MEIMFQQVTIITLLLIRAFEISASCAGEMPNQPQPGQSHSGSILVKDPNLGEIERTFRIHLPSGYSTQNDVETPLVLYFHGYAGDSSSQEYNRLDDVADEDKDGGFIVVRGDGWGNPSDAPSGSRSWNCSRTDGPLGPPCLIPRPRGHEYQCSDTCPECDSLNSCDWSACLDDEIFVRAIVDYVNDNYCIDMNSIHLTGYSNGGTFSYFVINKLSDIVASIAPNAASPFIGFGDVPKDMPISVIDFHGLLDSVIPYDANSPFALGEGPHNSVETKDYYFYEQKPETIAKWADEYQCNDSEYYPTPMDGINGWSCEIWSSCLNGAEIVHCTGLHGHNYPFGNEQPPYIEGTRILWNFMKTHKKLPAK